MFSANRFLQHDDVKDGHAQTIFAGEVVGDYLPWGHPRNWRDPADGINQGSHTFGSPERDWCFMLMGDGSVRKVNESIDRNVLKALSTPNGGEDVGDF